MQSECHVLIVIFGLPGSTIFATLSHKRHDFGEKVTEHKMPVSIFSTTFVWNISHSKNNWARYYHKGTQAGTRYSCHILMKIELSWQSFDKYSNIKFNKNPSNRSLIVPCGRIDVQKNGETYRQKEEKKDMTNFIVIFRNFANTPKYVNFLLSAPWRHIWEIEL